jgi:cellulose synthase/poly-beta-1,6-N-acetylglucosamine synthase-like glycosyltransferase
VLPLTIFWVSLAAVAWAWAGYPLLTALAAAVLRHVPMEDQSCDAAGDLPSVSVIVAVHNEERALSSKLRNCLELDYPDTKVEVLVASDGSQDGTVEIARDFERRHGNVRVVASPARSGKSSIQNAAAKDASGDILLFTDVATVLSHDALRIVAAGLRPSNAGCVTGRVTWRSEQDPGKARSENLYWRYEQALWEHETLLGTLSWALGPCLAVKRSLFRPIEAWFGDDVVIPFDVLAQGFRVVYEPSLVALEESRESSRSALRARVRMTLRSLSGTVARRYVYRPWKRPGLFVTVISHKLLRWATPFLFLGVIVAAVPLAVDGYIAAQVVLAAQGAGIVTAGAGWLAVRYRLRIPIVSAAYDLALENIGMLVGVLQAAGGRRQCFFGEQDQSQPGSGARRASVLPRHLECHP